MPQNKMKIPPGKIKSIRKNSGQTPPDDQEVSLEDSGFLKLQKNISLPLSKAGASALQLFPTSALPLMTARVLMITRRLANRCAVFISAGPGQLLLLCDISTRVAGGGVHLSQGWQLYPPCPSLPCPLWTCPDYCSRLSLSVLHTCSFGMARSQQSPRPQSAMNLNLGGGDTKGTVIIPCPCYHPTCLKCCCSAPTPTHDPSKFVCI